MEDAFPEDIWDHAHSPLGVSISRNCTVYITLMDNITQGATMFGGKNIEEPDIQNRCEKLAAARL